MAASGPSLCPVSVLQTLSAQGRNRRRRAIGNCRAEVSSCDPQTPCTATIMRARRIIDKMAGTELRAAAQDSRHQARRRCPGPMRGRSHAAKKTPQTALRSVKLKASLNAKQPLPQTNIESAPRRSEQNRTNQTFAKVSPRKNY